MSKFLKALSLGTVLATLPLLAATAHAGDAEKGEKVFKKCAACHAVGEGAKNKVGPELNEIFGRTAGSLEDYKYSKAMIEAGGGGLVWDEATLTTYLTKPKDMVKGTKMAFAGLKKDDEVANVLAYLRTFSQEAAAAPAAAETGEVPVETAAAAAPPEPAPAADMVVEKSQGAFGLGRKALPEEIAAWDIDIRPDGTGLPEGSGTVAQGEPIYTDNCAVCHGDFGEGAGRWPVLAGGQDTLRNDRPEKTIGSYWPYLSTVFDYTRRAMPFGNARSLSDDDVYALTAYLLYLNDIVTDEEFELSKSNFESVRLPNEANFVDDDRKAEPQYADKAEPCMKDCAEGAAKIIMHAAVLDVTPEAADGDEAPAAGIE